MLHQLFRSFVLLTLFAVVSASSKPAAPEGYTAGVPWTGEAGVRERTSDIMQREAAQPSQKHLYRIHKLPRVEVPEFPEGAVAPPGAEEIFRPLASGSSFAQTVSSNFLGATLA